MLPAARARPRGHRRDAAHLSLTVTRYPEELRTSESADDLRYEWTAPLRRLLTTDAAGVPEDGEPDLRRGHRHVTITGTTSEGRVEIWTVGDELNQAAADRDQPREAGPAARRRFGAARPPARQRA